MKHARRNAHDIKFHATSCLSLGISFQRPPGGPQWAGGSDLAELTLAA